MRVGPVIISIRIPVGRTSGARGTDYSHHGHGHHGHGHDHHGHGHHGHGPRQHENEQELHVAGWRGRGGVQVRTLLVQPKMPTLLCYVYALYLT